MILNYLEQSDLFSISKTGQKRTLRRWLIGLGVRECDIKQNAKHEIIVAKPVLDAAMGVEIEIDPAPVFEMDLSA